MQLYPTPSSVRLAITIGVAIAFAQAYAVAQGDSIDVPAGWREDAALRDVAFASVDYGVAVGDHGVLWRTNDGGRAWTLIPTSTSASLASVCLLDERHGWAVGGSTLAGSLRTQAVILRTKDGGMSWQSLPCPTMPALARVRFFSRDDGVAVGAPSPVYPSSVFVTRDGGRTWTAWQIPGARGWIDSDFVAPESGFALAFDGAPHALRGGREAIASRALDVGRRRSTRIAHGERGILWIAGDGGLLQVSRDDGRAFAAPAGELPDAVRDVDWSALAARGRHVWVAGSPGSFVLRSTDAGETWSTFPTGVSTPLLALHFWDDRRGWAVGATGAILYTRDGGQSWRVQRPGRRAAALGVFARASTAPWEAFARLAAHDGQRVALEFLIRDDRPSFAAWPSRTRVAEAGAAIGAVSSVEGWSLAEAGEEIAVDPKRLHAAWNAAHDGRLDRRATERIVRAVRIWRPDVTLVEEPTPRGGDPAGHLANQWTIAAVEQAADPEAFPEHATLGLAPWRARRVVASLRRRKGTIDIHGATFVPTTGATLTEMADGARSLLSRDPFPATPSLSFQVLVEATETPGVIRDFFTAIPSPADSDGRRPTIPTTEDPRELARIVQRRTTMHGLLERSGSGAARDATWLASIDEVVRGAPAAAGAGLLRSMAQRYARTGRPELAAEVWQALAARYPEQPHAETARLWLMQYHASGEAGWVHRHDRSPYVPGAPTPANVASQPRPKSKPSDPKLDDANSSAGTGFEAELNLQIDPSVVPASAVADETVLRAMPREEIALRTAREMNRVSPTLFLTPQAQFPLASAARARHGAWAGKGLRALAEGVVGDPWRDCAATELWLAQKQGPPPKSLAECRKSPARPTLDGKLDDTAWLHAERLPLRLVAGDVAPADAPPPESLAAFAYDDEYLYLAVRCPKADAAPVGERGPRKHDFVMQGRDRVDFLLDLDRDYSSCFRLTVDSAGHTADACFGDLGWNPTWYVATSSDEESWTAECAVPWKELAAAAPAHDSFWAFGVQRTSPGRGLQAWSLPAAVEPRPEGFGLLRFVDRQPSRE